MSAETNKAVIVRMNQEVWERNNLKYLEEVIHPDYMNRTAPPDRPRGPGGFRPFALRAAFPDAVLTVEDMLAEADRVVTRYTIRGTHRGIYAGIPPTGQRIVIHGMTLFRLSAGKVIESWSYWDDLDLLHQLGAIPCFQVV